MIAIILSRNKKFGRFDKLWGSEKQTKQTCLKAKLVNFFNVANKHFKPSVHHENIIIILDGYKVRETFILSQLKCSHVKNT